MTDLDRAAYASRPPRPLLRALVLVLLAFLCGVIAMAWALTRWEAAAPYLAWLRPDPVVVTRPVAVVTPPPAAPAPEFERRVAALEKRIDRVADRADAASGNADRAEGMLVAFAARRALDRGVQLGYIEALLRERFGGVQPQAVATVLSAARQPVTIDELRTGLDAVAPQLSVPGADPNWWDGAKRELAGLITLRRADMPSPHVGDRLARARASLDSGRVDAALAEVARMPGRAAAGEWITLARRYVAARNALDMIETAALLDPHSRSDAKPMDTPPATE
jgi:hypothetical protein